MTCKPKPSNGWLNEVKRMRIAMGLSYNGQAYEGWQSQLSGLTRKLNGDMA